MRGNITAKSLFMPKSLGTTAKEFRLLPGRKKNYLKKAKKD